MKIKTLLMTGLVLAWTGPTALAEDVEISINEELANHTKHFEKKIYKVGDNVYSAVGWSIANVIMIEGNEGVIIFDTGLSPVEVQGAKEELEKITSKPVVAVIYSHFHPDHWGGVKAFVSEDDVQSGRVKIFAHETLMNNVVNQGGIVGPILGMRTAYTVGFLLEDKYMESMNAGIGPLVKNGKPSFIAPTDLVANERRLTIAGVDMIIKHVPSEAADEIMVFLPAQNILLSGETIQGPTLPNIHAIRGTRFRDPLLWYQSIDKLRSFEASYLVPSHGQPVYGADKVEEVLRMTRDGIQFTHDQTIRLMNKGFTPDELANAIDLPPYLKNYSPYLREYYGTVKHTVRQIYNGYLGWFSGDPVTIDPTPRKEAASRLTALMGGVDKVLAAAEDAMTRSEYQWAAELATYVIRTDLNHVQAREIKAKAFRHLAYVQMNINWRNWYLTSAMELEGDIEPIRDLQKAAALFSSPDIVRQWPLSKIVNGLSFRLNPALSGDLDAVVQFRAIDSKEVHNLWIRKAVAEFQLEPTASPDVVLEAPKAILLGLISGSLDLNDVILMDTVTVSGDRSVLTAAMKSFDPVLAPIYLTIR